jgi:ribonuclease HI
MRQHPSNRRWDPPGIWGHYDWKDHECHIRNESFVRSRCDCCAICRCSGLYEMIDMIPCVHSDVCRCCGKRRAHGGAIIIATDGACRNNGRSNAASGCGVFFGMYSAHNIAFQPEDARPTNQRAELQAVICALSKIRHMAANGGLENEVWINEIIIKTDSAFVVNSMTDWIVKWRDNGYLSAKGVAIVNRELI